MRVLSRALVICLATNFFSAGFALAAEDDGYKYGVNRFDCIQKIVSSAVFSGELATLRLSNLYRRPKVGRSGNPLDTLIGWDVQEWFYFDGQTENGDHFRGTLWAHTMTRSESRFSQDVAPGMKVKCKAGDLRAGQSPVLTIANSYGFVVFQTDTRSQDSDYYRYNQHGTYPPSQRKLIRSSRAHHYHQGRGPAHTEQKRTYFP